MHPTRFRPRSLLYQVLFLFGCMPLVEAQSSGPEARNGQPVKKIRSGTMAGYIAGEYQQPLAGATVAVMDQASGMFVSHTLSDQYGKFSLHGVPVGRPVEVRISFSGYMDTSGVFTVKDTVKVLWTGSWGLHVLTKELEAARVSRRRPPFVIKKDTVEFDATQFKSLPNDVVKDLLRKLPGMHIGIDGRVTMNGKPVERVKVDGRDFMGGDLQGALDNLPGTMIDKVQVTENRKEGEENTRIVKKPADSYTLNLTLKKENKVGAFGTAEAAKGSPGLGWAKGFLNVSKGHTRLTALAAATNVNTAGFGGTYTEGVSRSDGASGILKRGWSGRFDLNTSIGKKGTLDLNGFNFQNRTEQDVQIDRQTFLPDSSFQYNSRQRTVSDHRTHVLSVRVRLPVDSLQTLEIRPEINYRRSDKLDRESAQTSTSRMIPINSQDTKRGENGRHYHVMNSLLYSLTSRDHRTHVTLSSDQRWQEEKGEQEIEGKNTFYAGADSTGIQLRQYSRINNKQGMVSADLTVKRDLSSKIASVARYGLFHSSDDQRKDVYKPDSLTGRYDVPDTAYSNYFRNTSTTHSTSLGFGYTGERLTAEVTAGLVMLNRRNVRRDKATSLDVRQRNFSPEVNLSYAWNKYVRQDISYNFMTEQPGSDKLAPVPDNSNPLVLHLGNPNLRGGLSNHVSSGFSFNYPAKGIMMMGYAGAIWQKNSIVADNYFDSLGRQVLSYRNVDGTGRTDAGFNASWARVRKDWRLQLMFELGYAYDVSKGFINRQENRSRNRSWSSMLGVGTAWKEKVQLDASCGLSQSDIIYSLPGSIATNYHTLSISGQLMLRPVTRVKWSNILEYHYNSQIPAGFRPSSTTLDTRLDYSFLKEQRLTVFCLVSDVLNKFNGLQRTVSATQIETRSPAFLGRCVLVGIKYRFSKFEQPAAF